MQHRPITSGQPLTSAEIARQVDALDRAARKQQVKLIADRHRAVLDSVEATTDFFPTLTQAKYLRRYTAQLERFEDLGMLGENGIAPAIADVAKQAVFHGFNWRARA